MEDEKDEGKKTRDAVLREILSHYAPAKGPADYEPTTKELIQDISETIEMKPDELTAQLILQGFHLKRVGTVFRWQMDLL